MSGRQPHPITLYTFSSPRPSYWHLTYIWGLANMRTLANPRPSYSHLTPKIGQLSFKELEAISTNHILLIIYFLQAVIVFVASSELHLLTGWQEEIVSVSCSIVFVNSSELYLLTGPGGGAGTGLERGDLNLQLFLVQMSTLLSQFPTFLAQM